MHLSNLDHKGKFVEKLPETELTEIEYGKEYPVKMGMMNQFVIKSEKFYFYYQLDVDKEDNKNDVITLRMQDGSWEDSVEVGTLSEVEEDWVKLVFKKPPPSGTFDMIHDPKDDKTPFYIFKNYSFSDLKKTQE